MASWTFDSLPFTWLRQEAGGAPAEAGWDRAPRLVIRPLLGLGDADIARVGYEPWQIAGPVFVLAANAGALLAKNGEPGLLSDGTTTWTAVLQLSLKRLAPGADYAGTATFTRARA